MTKPKEGCCYRIGFGTLFEPCCLETTPNSVRGACQGFGTKGVIEGGAIGFSPSGCPSNAKEAHTWIRNQGQGSIAGAAADKLEGGSLSAPAQSVAKEQDQEVSYCFEKGFDEKTPQLRIEHPFPMSGWSATFWAKSASGSPLLFGDDQNS